MSLQSRLLTVSTQNLEKSTDMGKSIKCTTCCNINI